MAKYENTDVVLSVITSLDSYEKSQDFSHLLTMGSKLSFIAYSIDRDDALAEVVPSLITFTEIIHRISLSDTLVKRFEPLIQAYLNDIKAWLKNCFLEDKHDLVAINAVDSLKANVQSIQALLEDKEDIEDLDDIFF